MSPTLLGNAIGVGYIDDPCPGDKALLIKL